MIKETNPNQLKKIDYHRDKQFIFSKHKIDEQIQKALKSKVWLKSGAHLVIDHTEAMVVVDVNSGRFIGKKLHEENSLKINLEEDAIKILPVKDLINPYPCPRPSSIKSPPTGGGYELMEKFRPTD